jgi:hypothetical protein
VILRVLGRRTFLEGAGRVFVVQKSSVGDEVGVMQAGTPGTKGCTVLVVSSAMLPFRR